MANRDHAPRQERPRSLLLDVAAGTEVAVGAAGSLRVADRDGRWTTMRWRESPQASEVIRRLAPGYGMPLDGVDARIYVERKKGSRVRIRIVADAAVRIAMRAHQCQAA